VGLQRGKLSAPPAQRCACTMSWGLLGIPTDLVPPPLVPPQALGTTAGPFLADAAVAALRHAPLLVLCLLQLYAVGAGATETPEDPPCSKALGFNESSGPKDRWNQDLQFCNEHHKRTCCEKNHTRQVLAHFGPFAHDRSQRCAQMSKLVLCALCDGDVGEGIKSRLNSILLCPSMCKRWFNACIDDLFAPSGSAGGLVPCMPSHVICSPLGEITEDSAHFCRSIPGYDVAIDEDDSCYDGVPSARSRGKGPRQAYERPKPVRPPWWRRMMSDFSRDMAYAQQHWGRELTRMRVPRWIQSYLPAMIVGSVGLLFALCILKG